MSLSVILNNLSFQTNGLSILPRLSVLKQAQCAKLFMGFTGSGSLQNGNEKDGNGSPSCARGLQTIGGKK